MRMLHVATSSLPFPIPGLHATRLAAADGSGRNPAPLVRILFPTHGGVSWQIPEIGRKTVRTGEWCVLCDLSAASTMHSEPEANGLLLEINIDFFAHAAESGWSIPRRLNCLICPRRDVCFFVSGHCCPRMRSAVGSCAEDLDESTGSTGELGARLQQTATLFDLFGRVLKRPELQGLPACGQLPCRKDRVALEGVAAELDANPGKPHTLADLARHHFLNEFKLKKGFREYFGTTVFGYLRQRRMEYAYKRLTETHDTIIEIANTAGYSNASHFARAFQEVHGCRPSDVRATPA